jgi:hypothetical protein
MTDTDSPELRNVDHHFLEDSDMMVDMKDGRCRSCESALQIIDADDATMTVECIEWT